MFRQLALALALCVFTALSPVLANDRGSPDEAKALALKSAEYLKSNGPDKAFADFNRADGGFRDRDLYVFVVDPSGKVVANANAALIGRNVLDLKDVEGKPFVREMLAIKDTGWVDYRWPNPVTKAVEPKTSYVVAASGFWIGVGAYKN